MTEIHIFNSKRKLLLLVVGAAILTAASFLVLFIMSDEEILRADKNPLIARLAGAVGLVFFGCGGVWIWRKMFDPQPVLIINDEGITDLSSAINVGLIRWRNITNIRLVTMNKTQFIAIDINNSEEILSRMSSVTKTLVQVSQQLVGSLINLSPTNTTYKLKDLLLLLQKEWQEHGGLPISPST